MENIRDLNINQLSTCYRNSFHHCNNSCFLKSVNFFAMITTLHLLRCLQKITLQKVAFNQLAFKTKISSSVIVIFDLKFILGKNNSAQKDPKKSIKVMKTKIPYWYCLAAGEHDAQVCRNTDCNENLIAR